MAAALGRRSVARWNRPSPSRDPMSDGRRSREPRLPARPQAAGPSKTSQTWRRVCAPHSAPRGSVASRARASDSLVDVSQRLRANSGRPHRAAHHRQRAPRGQSARRSRRATRRGLRAARLRRRHRAPLSVRLRHPGLHGRGADVAQPLALSPDVSRGRRRAVRRRRRARVRRRLRGRVDRVRRQPVRRLAGHGPLPLVPLRRGRPVRRRALSHARVRRTPRDRRQVQRRVRRHDHADAAAGPVRRAGQPRRRRALRALLHSGLRQGRPRRCAPTTARTRSSGRTSRRARR